MLGSKARASTRPRSILPHVTDTHTSKWLSPRFLSSPPSRLRPCVPTRAPAVPRARCTSWPRLVVCSASRSPRRPRPSRSPWVRVSPIASVYSPRSRDRPVGHEDYPRARGGGVVAIAPRVLIDDTPRVLDFRRDGEPWRLHDRSIDREAPSCTRFADTLNAI